jgi:hypothetical protein
MIGIIFLVLIGIVVGLVFVTKADYQIRQIVRFQRRRTKAVNAPSLVLAQSTQKRKVLLTDVRDLVVNLQLGTSMESTLTGSLVKAAQQFADRGELGKRLQRHVEARLSISPEAVLEGLVEDFDCTQLREVLERIRMAADGGISYNRVLAVSANAIEEDIRAIVEQQVQKAPIRLAPIMVSGVSFPALVLFMVPLIMSAFLQLGSG